MVNRALVDTSIVPLIETKTLEAFVGGAVKVQVATLIVKCCPSVMLQVSMRAARAVAVESVAEFA